MTAAANPLLPLVLEALRATPQGCSEHTLLKHLETVPDAFPPAPDEPGLALFQKHFLLMNALYSLQDSLWREEGLRLEVSALHIGFAPAQAAPESASTALDSGSAGALRSYYLDWHNFTGTDSATVAALLDGFWRRFHGGDRRAGALAVLQLEAGSDWARIKHQYRRLAARSHPDRGGDRAQFLAVRAAYETLREHCAD